jgi:hypothetical protein
VNFYRLILHTPLIGGDSIPGIPIYPPGRMEVVPSPTGIKVHHDVIDFGTRSIDEAVQVIGKEGIERRLMPDFTCTAPPRICSTTVQL